MDPLSRNGWEKKMSPVVCFKKEKSQELLEWAEAWIPSQGAWMEKPSELFFPVYHREPQLNRLC